MDEVKSRTEEVLEPEIEVVNLEVTIRRRDTREC